MIDDRPILVTGAGGGLGSALVGYLLDQGHTTVIGQYRSSSEKLKAVLEARDLPMSVERYMVQADLTNESEVTALHVKVRSTFGPLWGLINLAGSSSNAMSWKMGPLSFNAIINDNLLTAFLMSRAFIPEMREQEGGRIINTSSVVAFSGAVGAAHYCAAKAGLVGLTRAMSLELANKGITVNVMALGYFDRGLIEHLSPELQADVKSRTPLRRFGGIEEMGGLIRFLLSDEGAFTTGQVHHINGGYHL